MSARKKTLCLDFDGTLSTYSSGWLGADKIPDPPVPGALQFIAAALDEFDVAIFSSRSHQDGGIAAMKNWLAVEATKALHPSLAVLVIENVRFPTEKPAAWVSLDDRAITFNGTWPDLDELHDFEPWYRKTTV